MTESRHSPRMRTLLKGTIVFSNRMHSFDCLVRNWSDTGARLEFGTGPTVPDNFELDIPQKSRVYRCIVAWRRGNEIGVHFVHEDKADPAVALLERLKTIEQQNNRLRRQLLDSQRSGD